MSRLGKSYRPWFLVFILSALCALIRLNACEYEMQSDDEVGILGATAHNIW